MRVLSTALLLFAALVNLAPVSGVLSEARLQALYGIPFEDANLEILMRHRAILFGFVGGLLVAAAFRRGLRPAGLVVGLISMLSFVAIAWGVGGYNAELQRIVVFDLVASVALLASTALDRLSPATEARA